MCIDTKKISWKIYYCIDSNRFFISSNEYSFWKFFSIFPTMEDAIRYFESNVNEFIRIRNKIVKDINAIAVSSNIFLEETSKMYSGK